jgi:hypothetical protein
LPLATTQSNETPDAIHQVGEQFRGVLRRQAEHIEKLDQSLKLLRNEQHQLEEVADHLIEPLEKTLANGEKTKALSPSSILLSVRRLAAATYAEQVFASLTEEAAHLNVRSAVFDVRGRAAWGTSARGFEPAVSGEALLALVVPLNQAGPFRQAFETAEAVETSAEGLAKNRNVLAKLGPSASARVLLIPVRSAGSVAAIFYAETGERRDPILIDTLKVLAEFAGAQIDRLMAMNSGLAEVKSAPGLEEPQTVSEPAAMAPERETEAGEAEVASSPRSLEVVASGASAADSASPPSEEAPFSLASRETADVVGEHQAPAKTADITYLSDEEQKIHRDAQRFSKLLVTEIELYNRSGVEEGRKNRDLYLRLKKDIDRSRETYEKRFANTVAKQVDYFHEELVRRLAENDPALLGSDYPGPSV